MKVVQSTDRLPVGARSQPNAKNSKLALLSVLPFVLSMQAAYAAVESGDVAAQRDSVEARFDEDGNPCFDPVLIRRAKLTMPAALALEQPVSAVQEIVDGKNSQRPVEVKLTAGCYDYRDTQSRTAVDLDPEQDAVRFSVPGSALQLSMPDYKNGASASQTASGAGKQEGDNATNRRRDFDVNILTKRGLDPVRAAHFAQNLNGVAGSSSNPESGNKSGNITRQHVDADVKKSTAASTSQTIDDSGKSESVTAMNPHADVKPLTTASVRENVGASGKSERSKAAGRRVDFDMESLMVRGLDPALAQYFAQKPRFRPGRHRINLSVNDMQRGSVDARFDEEGNLCFDPEFIRRAKLIMRDALAAEQPVSAVHDVVDSENPPKPVAANTTASCYDYRDTQSQTEIELDPSLDAVRIVAPASALQLAMPGDGYSSGGIGAMLNYDILTSTFQNSSGSDKSLYVNLVDGVNAGDWILRSQQMFSSDSNGGSANNGSRVQIPYAYAQRTFPAYRSIVQGGRIVSQTPMFIGMPIDGVQIMPDDALSPRGNGTAFEGIVQSQARVEVRQAGLLIYTTVVPAGPFSLTNLPLVDNTSNVEVKIIESDGQSRVISVAAASLVANLQGVLGFSASLGKLRGYDNGFVMKQPLVAAVSKGWRFTKTVTGAVGGMASSGYQALAVSAYASLSERVKGSAQTQMTHAQTEGVIGNSTTVNLYGQLTPALSANAYGTWQSYGYRSIYSTLLKDMPEQPANGADTAAGVSPQRLNAGDSQIKTQIGTSIGWTDERIGSVSLAYSRVETYGGTGGQRVMASWSRKIGKAYASLSLERALGANSGGTSAYASVSMPLGKVDVSSYATSSNGQRSVGVRASQTVNDYLSYSVSGARSQAAGSDQLNVSAALRPRYTQANINAGSFGGGTSKSFSAQLQGGVVATDKGVTLSPYAVGDTFGVASAGDLSGVKIDTPQGPVWTDYRGYAAIPSMQAYSTSNLQIITKTLPRNVDVRNGFQEVSVGRGSVSFVDFGVVKVRRILLDIRFADGQALPRDSGIFDAEDSYVTTAVADGQVFLDKPPASALYAKTPDGRKCELVFQLPEKQDLDAAFEHVDAVCR